LDPKRAYFEKLAEQWDAIYPNDRAVIIERLLGLFDDELSNCDRILDVGTGTGMIIPILEKRYPRAEIISIDLAFEMLIRAGSRVKDTELVQADVHKAPFPIGTFNAVICHGSFPHFRDKEATLREFKRLSKPYSQLLIIHDNGREKINDIHRHADARLLHKDILPDGKTLARLVVKAGYKVDTISDDVDKFIVHGHLPG